MLLDTRDERPGVEFTDADLVGIPHRLTVGPRGLPGKKVEWKRRRDGATREFALDHAAEAAAETIADEHR